jgi:N-acyl-D-aspartate/D-glutamate deacylase
MLDLLIRRGTLADGTGAPPRLADVAIAGEKIDEVAAPGSVDPSSARAVIDAQGLVVTPGFVDVHTHYDGQATWDPVLAPSSWHGVTSLVMGNCGVGFAPVRPDAHQELIELMEGVEDIPGSALSEGIRWDWESFPEYLDALESMQRCVEIAAQVPHGAVRAYVMGERGARNEPATPGDIAAMAEIVREAIAAGAVAFSSNRMPLHTSLHGEPVPGTFAGEDEFGALLRAVRDGGGRIVEVIPAGAMGEDREAPLREVELYRRLSLETGCAITFSLAQINTNPKHWEGVLEQTEKANAAGARLVPQVSGRPAGLLLSWDTFNPFMDRPSYRALARLPSEERLRRLREPATRDAILAERAHDAGVMSMMLNSLDATFALDGGPVFEPDPDESMAARIARAGQDTFEALYDTMCELAESAREGQPGFMHVFFSGYKSGNLEDIGAMMRHPDTVVGLADGGAHCSMICDASMPSFLLQHWVRDRSRGPRLPLEDAVRMLTRDPAELYGLDDRGTVEAGKRADLNLIDLGALRLHAPETTHDLPTGAARIVQRTDGYRATIVAGEVTFRDALETGARPGQLIRR